MKYIITESRLNNLILKWMDDSYGDLNKIDYPYSTFVYLTRDDSTFFSYDKRNGYVRGHSREVGEYLQSLFNLDIDQMEEITKLWLRTRYDLEPRFVEFHY